MQAGRGPSIVRRTTANNYGADCSWPKSPFWRILPPWREFKGSKVKVIKSREGASAIHYPPSTIHDPQSRAALPRVTVIIPTYNRSRFVCEAIDSVLAQNYANLELLVIDDGSTDNTAQVVSAYGPAVRYLRQANAGAAAARNRGIELATGTLVAFLDSDDLFLDGKLARQVQVFARQPETVFAYSWFSILDEAGRTRLGRRCRLTGCVAEQLLAQCMQGPLATPTIMVRRDALRSVGGFDETMHLSEDIDLWCRLARLGPIALIPEVLVEVRRHGGNLSRGPGRRRYLAAALRILNKAFAADSGLGASLRLKLYAKAHLWSWMVRLAGMLPRGASFRLRSLWTNPVATLRQWLSRKSTNDRGGSTAPGNTSRRAA
ncbi:MAG: glycosyltransferase [Planctomycetaceae bacterium]|nr:glycosyltransferase [Planctomycetaceae bacterium]